MRCLHTGEGVQSRGVLANDVGELQALTAWVALAYAAPDGYGARGGVSMRILVAEDSATMRKVVQMAFAGEDAEILAVSEGALALERVREFQPDVILADASMTGMDGYELARAIKSDPEIARTPVILLASQHHPYDEQRAAETGVDDHLVKPFDSQVAIDMVHGLTKPGASLRPASIPAMPIAAGSVESPSGSIPIEIESVPPSLQPAPASAVPSIPKPPSAPSPLSAPVEPPPVEEQWQAAPAPVNGGEVLDRLVAMGLTAEQIEGVLRISAEVVERVVWEVVPDLAETLIREEIDRLTGQ